MSSQCTHTVHVVSHSTCVVHNTHIGTASLDIRKTRPTSIVLRLAVTKTKRNDYSREVVVERSVELVKTWSNVRLDSSASLMAVPQERCERTNVVRTPASAAHLVDEVRESPRTRAARVTCLSVCVYWPHTGEYANEKWSLFDILCRSCGRPKVARSACQGTRSLDVLGI